MKNNKMLKIWSLAMAGAMSVSMLAACNMGGGAADGTVDLLVKYYNGAYGEAWIKNAADDFIAKKAAEGVTVTIDLKKDSNMDATVATEVGTGNNLADIYMVRDCNWTDWVTQGKLENLTSVYETEVETSQGKQKIKDYMSDGYNMQYYAQRQAGVGEYMPWAMPWSASQIGLVYNENILKSTGRETPPETVEELMEYCADLVDKGITPFVFPGKESHWFRYLIQVWWAQYQGAYEENTLNIAEGAGSFYDYWNMAEADVLKQKGIQVGIDTMQKLFVAENGGWKNSMANVDSYKVSDAEQQFVDYEKAAMLVGASFMYNEVEAFIKPGTVYKMMSLPTIENAMKNADGSTAKINYYTSEDRMIVPKGAPNAEAAKEFLAFMCNEKYLLDFISKTGTVRPFKYADSVLDATKLGLNEFETSVLEVYKNSDVKLVSLPANIANIQDRTLISLYKHMQINGAWEWGTMLSKIKENQASETIMTNIYNDTVPTFAKWKQEY